MTATEEIREENIEERVQDTEREEEKISAEDEEEKGLQLVFPALPVSTWEMPTEVPPEQIGTGVNAKV